MMKIELNYQVFDHFPELKSERLTFRQITQEDAETMFEIRTNKAVMRYMDREAMRSISESEGLIQSIRESFLLGRGISWGIEEKATTQLIGYFGFWRIDASHCRAEIGFALHPAHWGQGYMREAAGTLLEFGFRELNLHSVEANVNPDNGQSMSLLEKIGFKKEAYFRENFLYQDQFKDSVIYSLLERDMKKE